MSNTNLVRNNASVSTHLVCDNPSRVPKASSSKICRVIVYDLCDRASGRHYVGLTTRTLECRLVAHISQARRGTPIRDGGLMSALRAMLEAGSSFETTWDARIVARADNLDEACALERYWIAALSAAWPTGYNLMPGGSSVGGPSNAIRLSVRLPNDGPRSYASIQEAIGALNRSAHSEGRFGIGPGTVYARLAQGWPPDEALGYKPHDDGRGQRVLFEFNGQRYTTLREASQRTGIAISTLRSRLHRLTRVEIGRREIGTDRRSSQAKGGLLQIPWPPTGESLTAAEFAARTNLPKATIMHRWHRAQKRIACEGEVPPETLVGWLTATVDRRKNLALTLPDGSVWQGGERELVRRLLANSRLKYGRAENLSESGIRRRLRCLSPGERQSRGQVAWAFGFTAKREG